MSFTGGNVSNSATKLFAEKLDTSSVSHLVTYVVMSLSALIPDIKLLLAVDTFMPCL